MRNAYYCAVADIVMEVTRRASDIVTSPSSSDREAFPLVHALDSAPVLRFDELPSTDYARQYPSYAIGHRSSWGSAEWRFRGRYGTKPPWHVQDQIPPSTELGEALFAGISHAFGNGCLSGFDSS